jgi:hypothetical protein
MRWLILLPLVAVILAAPVAANSPARTNACPWADTPATSAPLWQMRSSVFRSSGQLRRYIDEFPITGLTSNPSLFDKAIKSGAYDNEIRHKAAATPLGNRDRDRSIGSSDETR